MSHREGVETLSLLLGLFLILLEATRFVTLGVANGKHSRVKRLRSVVAQFAFVAPHGSETFKRCVF